MLAWFKQLLAAYGQDRISQLSAAFSYFTLFSVGPLLLVIISLAGLVLGEKSVTGQLADQLGGIFGPETAATIQAAVANTYSASNGFVGLIAGIITLLLGATGLFGQLQNSFDQIFRVKPDPKTKLFNIVWPKIKGILLLGVVSIMVVVSVVVSAVFSAVGDQAEQSLGIPRLVLQFINFGVSTILIGVLIGLLYRMVPNVVVPRKLALITGLFVGALFSLGKAVLGYVIGNNGTAGAFGAAASLIVLLLWVFYFGQIVFLGAEGLKIYGKKHNVLFEPKKRAVKQKIFETTVANPYARFVEAFQQGLNKTKK